MRSVGFLSFSALLAVGGCASSADIPANTMTPVNTTFESLDDTAAGETMGEDTGDGDGDSGDGTTGDGTSGDGTTGDGTTGDGTSGDGTTGDGTTGDGTTGDGDGSAGDGDGTAGDGDGDGTAGDGDGDGTAGDGDGDGTAGDGDGDGTAGDGDGTAGDGDGTAGDGDGDGTGDGDGDTCQDGVINGAEECDQSDLASQTCASQGFVSGALGCNADCTFNTSACLTCGDNVTDAGEDCDGTDIPETCAGLGYVSGTLGCDSGCQFDVTACVGATCGDGVISAPEVCDCGGDACTAAELATLGCADFPPFTAGVLGCGATSCAFDTSACYYCGDGVVDAGEDCDQDNVGVNTCLTVGGGFDSGTIACDNSTCTFDTTGCSTCGNGVLEGSEICDVGQIGSNTCASAGFVSGTVLCNLDCSLNTDGCTNCGNGIINLADGEQCDGTAFNDTCTSLGYISGSLGCTSACQLDVAACVGASCGDEVISAPEVCDCGVNGCTPTELANLGCSDFPPFTDGTLGCSGTNCQFDTAGCYYCGDGNLDPTESCDSGNVGTATCVTIGMGFTGGTLECNGATCGFDTSGCTVCGDGTKEGAEQCDLTDFGTSTCGSEGFQGGTLGCFGNCLFDTSGCDNCGDALIDAGEQCDQGNLNSNDCTTVGGSFAGGTLACDIPTCTFDTSGCSLCGNGAIDAGAGEVCDSGNLGANDCTTIGGGWQGGTLACDSSCGWDTSACDTCGNGTIEAGEECDGANLNGIANCSDVSLGLATELISCNADCTYNYDLCSGCGDMVVTPPEDCEPDDGAGSPMLDGETCVTQNFDGGSLGCLAGCAFDTTSCYECGDNVKNGSEECDASDFGTLTCLNFLATDGNPFLGGSLACTGLCAVDTTGCERCGDGVITGTEVCDGTELGLNTCASELGAAYESGSLVCNASCDGFITTGCTDCGDTIIEGDEDCDDPTYATSCVGLGFALGGTLACTPTCSHDTSGCIGATCGDGIITSPETCDCGGDACTLLELDSMDCTDFPPFDSGTLGCSASNCAFDTTGCYECGDNTSDPTETCDGTDLNGLDCTDFTSPVTLMPYGGGTLGCDAGCGSYDTTACTDVTPPPANPYIVCSTNVPLSIPDNDLGGVDDTISILESATILAARVSFTVGHTYIGDVEARITHNGTTRILVDNINGGPCAADNFACTFDDTGPVNVQTQCVSPVSGPVIPFQLLAPFNGMDLTGDWDINVLDNDLFISGQVNGWCMEFDW